MLVTNQDKPSTPEPNFPCRLDRTCDSLTHVQYVLKAGGAQRSGRGVTGGNRGNEDTWEFDNIRLPFVCFGSTLVTARGCPE